MCLSVRRCGRSVVLMATNPAVQRIARLGEVLPTAVLARVDHADLPS